MTDTTVSSPYAAPDSDLQLVPAAGEPLTIEQALARGYDFKIFAMLGEAWQRLKGTKRIILGSYLLLFVALLGLAFVLMTVLTALGIVSVLSIEEAGVGGMIATILSGILAVAFITALVYPFLVGVAMIGIRRAADQPVKFIEVFSHFGRILPLMGAVILMWLVSNLCMFILGIIGIFMPPALQTALPLIGLIPLIYLAVAYSLALPLVVERKLSPWQAMEASRKGISQHWFKVLGLFLMLFVFIPLLCAVPLALTFAFSNVLAGIAGVFLIISMIWTLPLVIVTNGILYRTIFGVLPAAQ